MITVNLPDGNKAQFPDGTTPDVMKAAIQKKFPPTNAGPPADAAPGSREYADWAAAQARQGKTLPQVSRTEPDNTGIVDKIVAATTGAVDALPIVGPSAMGALQQFKSNVRHIPLEALQQEDAAREAANPISATGGRVAGTVLPFILGGTIPGVAKGLGMAGNLGERVFWGGLSGSGIGAADTAARGGDADDIKHAAEFGAGLGVAFPLAARALAGVKNGVTDALRGSAAAAEPDASRLLKDTASQLFENAKGSGVQIAPESYQRFLEDMTRKVAATGLDRKLHPDTFAALENLWSRGGKPLSIQELHLARQVAQDATRGQLARDATKAGAVVDELDDFVRGLQPGDLVANGDRGPQAVKDLYDGIGLWAKASKMTTIEDALYRASNSATGLENGIRNEFRTILRNPKSRNVYTAEERNLMEQVVRGSVASNVLKLLGKFGFGRGQATNMVGGSVGFGAGSLMAGPLGGIVATLAASAARRGSEAMTERGAQRVLQAVSGGAAEGPKSLPKIIEGTARRINSTPVDLPIGPGTLPLLIERRPERVR